MNDDQRLVAAAVAGSERAGEELFARHWVAAWRLALSVTGSSAAADDIAQDAFERAFRGLAGFNGRSSFRTWLSRIVVNRAVDVGRRQQRSQPFEAAESLSASSSSDEDLLRDRDVLDAVAALAPERRTVVALRYWAQHSPAEIAEVLDLPLGTVHSRLARSLADLRSRLEVPDAANLEERLERATDSLPLPAETVTAQARESALAALPRRASRRRFTRRRPLGLIAVGAVVAIALAVALAAPWEGRTPLVTERALAAIGSQPVIHAVVENTRPYASILDLASGDETVQLLRTEYWFDDEQALLRARITIDGTLQTELLQTRKGGISELGPIPGNPTEPQLPPALAGFASSYREALENGNARVIGKTRVEEQEALLLQIELFSPPIDAGTVSHAEVAVDAESYKPLRFRYRAGKLTTEWWRVVSIETLAREERQFAPPTRAAPRPSRQTGTDERTLTPAEAATALGRPAVWPGRDVAGIGLAEIELMKLTTAWTDDRETVSRALVLQYGPRRYKAGDEPWLMITETSSRPENSSFRGFGGRDPEPGELKIRGVGDLDGSPADMWVGSMVVNGLYVALESARRDLVLAAARMMEPIE